ncbi:hypothetical protein Y032_0008g17 [Ancylostoma ceylanicum]|uniref:Uncharacterized protein n=1 Tax=Ancylostoma ceylanicum TaxID=53326 RepID=A0A016VLW5_9BILA|nr:hypothetical protein Y032_0008g17 [Ancylostoma ceylanicum]
MRELTIILLALVIAVVIASKETEGTKDPSSRSSSEEEKAVEASGEEALKKIEVAGNDAACLLYTEQRMLIKLICFSCIIA